MRPLISILILTAAAGAQSLPRIGVLDFYGLHKVPQSKVRQVLGVREGDTLPASKGDAEERLDDIGGVVESHLEAVCCDAGKMILYVGIEERGAPHFEMRDPPEDDVKLPDEITSTYRRFIENFEAASRAGLATEDLTQGYSLMADLPARAVQEMFPALAKDHLAELVKVLHDAGDEDQRATAAYVLSYYPDKKRAVSEMQFALKDADAGVRRIAARGLSALSVYARLNPDAELKIEPTWFIEMLNSLSWTDRRQALLALQVLTDSRDASVLEQLQARALPALIEMARWKSLEHALPAYVLVGRIEGLPEEQIQDGWARGDRETLLAAAANPKRKTK